MNVRGMFPILRRTTGSYQLAYLDSAASAQKPLLVTDTMKEFAEKSYANVHRGIHDLAEEATQMYEEARSKVAHLISAKTDEIVLTSGTTASINLVAGALMPTFKGGDIVVTIMEHHSNFVPWQQLAKRHGLNLKAIPLTPDYRLDMEAARNLITDSTRIVAVAHVSNVLGTINPIRELAALAHEHGALILVDGAQAVPHMRVDVKSLNADFYAFSGHKMYGPSGIGVLYGRREILQKMEPPAWGGEMVKEVTVERTTWNDPPWKYEPGTPNIIGAIGLGAAVDFLLTVGYDGIVEHERSLIAYALRALGSIPGVAIIGPQETKLRGGAISFTLEGVHPHDVAAALNERGIAVRAGHHCAQPLHCALGLDATTRVSFGIYNTTGEVDRLIEALEHVREVYA